MPKQYSIDEPIRMMVLADVTDQDIEQTEFEILKVGDYFDHRYGKFSITRDKLLALKKNFDDNVLEIDIALDANHEPEGGAYGWIKSLTVDGDRLLMALRDVTKRGKEVLKDKVFKYFSVEFDQFTKVVDGRKLTIPDVLRGVALTNRPVIKGMRPTFLSETANKSFTTSNMSVFKKFAEAKVAGGKVTAEDVTLAKAMFDELTPDEQEAEKPALESVEAEAAKTAEAEAAAKAEADKAAADKAAADAAAAAEAAKGEEGKEPDAVAAAELSEAKTKLSEANAKLAELTEKENERVLSEEVAKLTLSESNPRGFSKVHGDQLKGFVASLSTEQRVTFSELMGKFVTVNVKEVGSGIDGAKLDDAKVTHGASQFAVKGADVDAEIKALAEREKLSYFDASRKYAETHKS